MILVAIEALRNLVSTICIAIVVVWALMGWTHPQRASTAVVSLCSLDGGPQTQLDGSAIYAGVTADNLGCYLTLTRKGNHHE